MKNIVCKLDDLDYSAEEIAVMLFNFDANSIAWIIKMNIKKSDLMSTREAMELVIYENSKSLANQYINPNEMPEEGNRILQMVLKRG